MFGDNHDALFYLANQKDMEGKISLVYIDPPYGTGQDFTINETRFSTISRINDGNLAYSDKLTGEEYLKFLGDRLALIRTLMSDEASIYIHIDTKIGHYVKVLADSIFGQNNFINDITRIKCNPKNFNRKGYGNIKDMILLYSKTKNYIWNDTRQSVKLNEIKSRHNQIDSTGRYYTTTPLHAPGETKDGETGKEWRGMPPPKGRHWRYAPRVLDELDSKGLIEWSSNGNPRKIIFADDIIKTGIKIQDIWDYKDPQYTKYPTEKNIEMLKMIISASSNKGEYILDAFAGSGTTLVAAHLLGRNWIGIDNSIEAVNVCKERLCNAEYDYINILDMELNHERMVCPNIKVSNRDRLSGQTSMCISS